VFVILLQQLKHPPPLHYVIVWHSTVVQFVWRMAVGYGLDDQGVWFESL
jgi:hypothetical protein